MNKIYYRDTPFSEGFIQTTEAAYRQLTPAQRNNGKIYYMPLSYNVLSQDKELVDQNDTPAPTTRVTASGSYGSNYDPEYAFNDTWFEEDTFIDDSLIVGKAWVPPATNNNWIQYEFLKKEYIKTIDFQFIMGGGGQMVNPFVIMGSNDGTEWTTIATVPFSETRQAHYTFNVTMTINATTPYKYVRIQAQDLSHALYIVEIQIYTDKELINETEFFLMDEKYTKDTHINYNWYSAYNDTLVVRENINDGTFRWYFNWFEIEVANRYYSVPQDMQRFIKNNEIIYVSSIHDQTGTGEIYNSIDGLDHFYNGTAYSGSAKIGFYGDTVRGWTVGLNSNQRGIFQGIMESTDTGISTGYCQHVWEEPSFDPYFG